MERLKPRAPLRRTVPEMLYFMLLLMASSVTAQTDTRIVGGYPCGKGQPWQAALFSNQLSCGGVLVSKDWVLTSAHCRLPSISTVLLGEYNLKLQDESEQPRLVSKLIPHPHYNPTTRDNDIMLIKLTTPVQITNNVYPIALSRSAASPGTNCVTSGWGTTKYPIRSVPALLQCADLRIVSAAACRRAYPNSITVNKLCANVAQGGIDPCQVDSGGPLVCNGILQGIVSWRFGECALPQKPGVYTRVSNYITWIEATVRGG